MSNDLSKDKQEEYKRWQSYANALLLALTVLFAGTAIGQPKEATTASILSLISGLAGIIFTVLWFALEDDHKIMGKPAFLWVATGLFGLQAGLLAWAMIANFV